MGQVINFINNIVDFNPSLIDQYSLLLTSFNKLKSLTDLSLVISLSETDIEDDKNLSYIAKQIVAMKNAGINIVIIPPEITKDSFDFVKNMHKINPSSKDVEYIEMALWSKIALKISDKINLSGGIGMRISGIDANLVFGKEDDHIKSNLYDLKKNENIFAKPYRLNINFFEDIRKSNFIPIVTPVCRLQNEGIGIMNSVEFACFVAKNVDYARILISVDTDKFGGIQKIINTSQINNMIDNKIIIDDDNLFSNIVDVLNCTVDYVHLVKLSNSSILNEVTFTSSNGILIYNDNHDI